MIIITNVDTEHFSYEGIRYYKNFTPEVKGGKVRLVNTYDNKMELMPLKDFSEVEVDGVVHGSLSALQNALIPVVWLSAVSFNGQIDTSAFERFANKGVANGYTPLDGSVKVDKSYLPTLEVTDINGLPAALNLYEEKSNKGVANGYASLDANGLVPSTQLPAYVDDVLEGQYINSTTFNDTLGSPYTGETGKIYVDTTSNKSYRFSGSVYIEIKDDAAVWGSITGSLTSQTDLQNALNNVDAISLNGYTQSTSGSANRIPLIDGGGDLYVIRDYYTKASGSWSKVLSIANLDSNLPSNVARKDSDNNFSAQTFTGNINATGQNITAAAFIGDGSQVDNVDAETLDGFDSSDFVRLTDSVAQTVTGEKTFSSKTIFSDKIEQGVGGSVTGNWAVHLNNSNTVSGASGLGQGFSNETSGTNGSVFGNHNYSRATSEMSIGSYGTDYTLAGGEDPTDRLFNIGNGSSTVARSDAFTVYRSGNGTLSGTFKAGGYQSSDGSTGGTEVDLDMSTVSRMTFKNGLYITHTEL